MNPWAEMQAEVATWALHNFGDQGAHQPMMGLIEEVGEFIAAREQNLHLPKSRDEATDALADQAIYALNLCEKAGLSFAIIAGANPPEPLTDGELLGCLSLACRAVLKHEQGIRGYDYGKRRDELKISLSMWFRWASYQPVHYCFSPLLPLTQAVWEQVRRRDWRKNPVDAHTQV